MLKGRIGSKLRLLHVCLYARGEEGNGIQQFIVIVAAALLPYYCYGRI